MSCIRTQWHTRTYYKAVILLKFKTPRDREIERERPGCFLVKMSHVLGPLPSVCAAPSD